VLPVLQRELWPTRHVSPFIHACTSCPVTTSRADLYASQSQHAWRTCFVPRSWLWLALFIHDRLQDSEQQAEGAQLELAISEPSSSRSSMKSPRSPTKPRTSRKVAANSRGRATRQLSQPVSALHGLSAPLSSSGTTAMHHTPAPTHTEYGQFFIPPRYVMMGNFVTTSMPGLDSSVAEGGDSAVHCGASATAAPTAFVDSSGKMFFAGPMMWQPSQAPEPGVPGASQMLSRPCLSKRPDSEQLSGKTAVATRDSAKMAVSTWDSGTLPPLSACAPPSHPPATDSGGATAPMDFADFGSGAETLPEASRQDAQSTIKVPVSQFHPANSGSAESESDPRLSSVQFSQLADMGSMLPSLDTPECHVTQEHGVDEVRAELDALFSGAFTPQPR
jgi:hypothetical protein